MRAVTYCAKLEEIEVRMVRLVSQDIESFEHYAHVSRGGCKDRRTGILFQSHLDPPIVFWCAIRRRYGSSPYVNDGVVTMFNTSLLFCSVQRFRLDVLGVVGLDFIGKSPCTWWSSDEDVRYSELVVLPVYCYMGSRTPITWSRCLLRSTMDRWCYWMFYRFTCL